MAPRSGISPYVAVMTKATFEGTPSAPSSLGEQRIVKVPSRIVLWTVALVALTVGFLLLLHPVALSSSYTPFVLFAIGIAVFGAVLAGPSSDEVRESSPPTRTVGSATPEPAAPIPRPGRATLPVPAAAVSRPKGLPSARGSEWRVPPVTPRSRPGSHLSWLLPEHRHAGPEGGEMVPGVVASPGKAGSLVAFPVRNYYAGTPPPVSSPSPRPLSLEIPSAEPTAANAPSNRTRPVPGPTREPRRSVLPRLFSEEELDRMFPPSSSPPSVFLSDAPQRVGLSSSRGLRPDGPPSPRSETEEREGSDASGTLVPPAPVRPRAGASVGDLFQEAANPVSPHLRAAAPFSREEAEASAHCSRSSASPRSVCASCSNVVLNLRLSGPCPRCLRPICNDCLRHALVIYGHGWCLDCAAIESTEAASRVS